MLSVFDDENGEVYSQHASSPQSAAARHDPAVRGYNVVYREDKVNHCPGCGRTHWYVGRLMAECGFCATALPLAEASLRGSGHSRSFRAVWAVEQAA